jgi:uncharacterized membrane protein
VTGEAPSPASPPSPEPAPPTIEMGSERLEAFSDAVLAVIMTIMAFGLRVPDRPPTWVHFRAILPGLFVYVLSFAFIGIYWNNHHHLLRATKRISGAVMWANLFLLFWLSLIPVCTAWIRQEYKNPMPAMAYGVVSLCAAVAYSILVRSIIRANGSDSAVAQAVASDRKGYVSLALYASGTLLALVSPWLAYACYAAVSVMWFIPDRRFAEQGSP